MCVTIVCDWGSTKTTSYEQLLYPNWSNFIITFPYTNNLGNGFLVRAHLLPSSVVTTRTVKLGQYDTDLMLSEEKANQFAIIASLLPAIDTCASVWIPI